MPYLGNLKNSSTGVDTGILKKIRDDSFFLDVRGSRTFRRTRSGDPRFYSAGR